MFAAASFETTNPEATQSQRERERKKRRENEGREDKMSFCKSCTTCTGSVRSLVLTLPPLTGAPW